MSLLKIALAKRLGASIEDIQRSKKIFEEKDAANDDNEHALSFEHDSDSRKGVEINHSKVEGKSRTSSNLMLHKAYKSK